jgi:hypothetical protein
MKLERVSGRMDFWTGRLGFWTRRCLLVALAALAGGAAAAAMAPPASAASGSLLWSRGIQITAQREDFSDLARGPGGAVYGTGMSGGSQGSGDYLVAKYSPGGTRLWKRTFDGASNGIDWARALAVDSQGNVVVTGQSWKDGQNLDVVTRKYRSRDGKLLWTRRYNGEANDYDVAADVAVDADGNAYVCGTATVMGGKNIVVLKYGPAGTLKWQAMWAGPGVDDYAVSIALDAARHAYVVGTSDTPNEGDDCVTLKVSRAGNVAWAKLLDGYGSSDEAAAVAVRNGVVYAAASAWGPTQNDPLVAKYDSAGDRRWRRVRDLGPNDTVTGMALDASGRVYLAMTRDIDGSDPAKGLIASWTAGGSFRWSHTYYRSDTQESAGFWAIAADAYGRSYCGGWVARGMNEDSLVVKYRADGSRAWVRRFNSDPNTAAYTQCLLLVPGSNGGLYAGGRIETGGYDESALLLKYRP